MISELDKVNIALNHGRGSRTNQERVPKILKQQIVSLAKRRREKISGVFEHPH